jgi:hypothetical protein
VFLLCRWCLKAVFSVCPITHEGGYWIRFFYKALCFIEALKQEPAAVTSRTHKFSRIHNRPCLWQILGSRGCWEERSACISEMPKLMEFHVRYQSICRDPLRVLTFSVQWRFIWSVWARRASGEDVYNLHSNGEMTGWPTNWLAVFNELLCSYSLKLHILFSFMS